MSGRGTRIVALGGLGEIGMNCLALEQRSEVLLVDCGVTFPETDSGVDVLHPRFDYALDRDIAGVVLTHGHEDHIGGLPYLLRAVDVPVYGPPHALELARRRLDEHGFKPGECELVETPLRREYQVGSFTLEPLRVTHSIVDATALAIRTDAGLVVHTGDFKLDEHPRDGERTDLARFGELGDEGVRLLLSDSTNAASPGRSRSEAEVSATLEALVAGAKHRVFVGLFASNVLRMQALADAAKRSGRRMVLLGRSLVNQVRAAHAVGRLAWPSDLVVSPEYAATCPRDRVLVVTSGTQAERGSGLTRLATGTHPVLKVEPGDMVVFSSRIIPGNDRSVVELWGALLRAGADLVTYSDARPVHASGHAHRDEQLQMIELVRPQSFVPIHGALYHLTRHAELATDAGVAEVVVAENGEQVELADGAPLAKVARVPVGRVATFAGEAIDPVTLGERAQLGRQGLLVAHLVVDANGRVLSPPRVVSRGVDLSREGEARVAEALARAIERETSRESGAFGRDAVAGGSVALRDDEELESLLRTAARRALDDLVPQRPTIAIALTRLE